jgi:hypothetical protein
MTSTKQPATARLPALEACGFDVSHDLLDAGLIEADQRHDIAYAIGKSLARHLAHWRPHYGQSG